MKTLNIKKAKHYSVAESARNLLLAMRNNRNRHPKDEFSGLSPEEKLIRAIIGAQENIVSASEEIVIPDSDFSHRSISQEEIQVSEDIYSGFNPERNNKSVEDASAEKISKPGYVNKKNQRKKKYSAMSRQDMTDFEDHVDTNDNFRCNYASVRNSLSRIRC